MAHDRKRQVEPLFDHLLKFSPLLGVFGHRQVGKSTFLGTKSANYHTLDDLDQLATAGSDPKGFLSSKGPSPFVIDECQLEPKLFPTLKEWVRKNKRPGQFVLSGSVRFTSRKSIRESLAGRISLLEMLPFSITELEGEPLSEVIVQLLQHQQFSENSLSCLHSVRKSSHLQKSLHHYLEHGGLPGLCFIRSSQLRRSALNDLHELILSRDLRLISQLKTPVVTLKKWMSHIASRPFEPYNAAEVRRLFGLAPQTQKSLLAALESIFLIRRVPVPLRKKELILFEDQLEETFYSIGNLEPIQRVETALYRNLRTQFSYRLEKNAVFESYLTRDHARVPWVIKLHENTLGIIVTSQSRPSLSETRSANSFLRSYRNAKLIYLSIEKIQPKVLDERTLLCSVGAVL